LSAAKTITLTGVGVRAGQRHAYDELKQLQAKGDPVLASPYLAADDVETVAANGGSTGNLTLTLSFPKSGVEVTTGNIAYNAAAATINTAVDSALAGEIITSLYTSGDVDASCANMSSAVAVLTANGGSVTGVNMVVTTANVDMDVAAPAVVATTVGTGSRQAEAILNAYSCVSPASLPTPQGSVPAEDDYETGGNPLSLSPILKGLLVDEVEASEDAVLGAYFREKIGCV
jgi:hypothetical protein